MCMYVCICINMYVYTFILVIHTRIILSLVLICIITKFASWCTCVLYAFFHLMRYQTQIGDHIWFNQQYVRTRIFPYSH